MRNLILFCLAFLFLSSKGIPDRVLAQTDADAIPGKASKTDDKMPLMKKATPEQESKIRGLIEQLVFPDGEDGVEKQRQKFKTCQDAFNELLQMKALAIPFLLEHLDDKRGSINFRNHHLGHSVGDACFWNIYYQLQDRPKGYSSYGYSRKGRDGADHPKPYWEGTPFGGIGGLKKWVEENQHLNYVEAQIKCLQWLLDREKKIGAPDADSYLLNILPLEIQILERRFENGEDVASELEKLKRIRDNKLKDQIPKGTVPK